MYAHPIKSFLWVIWNIQVYLLKFLLLFKNILMKYYRTESVHLSYRGRCKIPRHTCYIHFILLCILEARHWNIVEILPCRVNLDLTAASYSCSSLLAFYLYICNYDFQYLLPGYFQTWFCLTIFPSFSRLPLCWETLSVVGKIILG